MDNEALSNVLSALDDLRHDQTLPKNVRAKLDLVLEILGQEDKDISLRINRALHTLDELTDETNLEAFVRTQVWNIVSMLEMIASSSQ